MNNSFCSFYVLTKVLFLVILELLWKKVALLLLITMRNHIFPNH